MKVAVTASGPGPESEVDPRFGRARYILILDSESGDVLEVLDNETNMNAVGGAGVQAAQAVADRGVSWLITGNVGPRAFQGLQAAGIKVAAGAEGTVSQALDAFREGKLREADGANVEGHW